MAYCSCCFYFFWWHKFCLCFRYLQGWWLRKIQIGFFGLERRLSMKWCAIKGVLATNTSNDDCCYLSCNLWDKKDVRVTDNFWRDQRTIIFDLLQLDGCFSWVDVWHSLCHPMDCIFEKRFQDIVVLVVKQSFETWCHHHVDDASIQWKLDLIKLQTHTSSGGALAETTVIIARFSCGSREFWLDGESKKRTKQDHNSRRAHGSQTCYELYP